MPPLDLERLRAFTVPSHRASYGPRDAIIYALGTGAGLSETVDETDLLFEGRLKVLSTMALVLGTPGFWAMDPRAGLDWPLILHGSQSLRLARPLATEGELIGTTRLGDVADKGVGGFALLRAHRALTTTSGTVVARLDETWVLRDAGGFGGPRSMPDTAPSYTPHRSPDATIDLPTARNQAAVYRLSGDRNPIHVDRETAAKAGFARPILHGLSTMGLVGRALVHLCCRGDPARLSSMSVRFTAPVVPGDIIRTEIWDEGGSIAFRACVAESGVIVIDGGRATIDSFEIL